VAKMKKLLRERLSLTMKVDTLTSVLMYLTHKNGGTLEVQKEDVLKVPEAMFTIDFKDGKFVFSITDVPKNVEVVTA
jgi:hypothetical protein